MESDVGVRYRDGNVCWQQRRGRVVEVSREWVGAGQQLSARMATRPLKGSWRLRANHCTEAAGWWNGRLHALTLLHR